jgi:hypothetical protein
MKERIEQLEKLGLKLHPSKSGKADYYSRKKGFHAGVSIYTDDIEIMTDVQFEKFISRIEPEPPTTNDVLKEILGKMERFVFYVDRHQRKYIDYDKVKEIFNEYLKK